MGKFKINEDKMLYAVLSNEELIREYNITLEDYNTLNSAYHSHIPVVEAIATIIKDIKNNDKGMQREVYKKIFNQLNNNLL